MVYLGRWILGKVGHHIFRKVPIGDFEPSNRKKKTKGEKVTQDNIV